MRFKGMGFHGFILTERLIVSGWIGKESAESGAIKVTTLIIRLATLFIRSSFSQRAFGTFEAVARDEIIDRAAVEGV